MILYIKNNIQISLEIPMESGQRNHDDNFKLQIYLKITQLQLEVDDSGNILLYFNVVFLVPLGSNIPLSSLYYKWLYESFGRIESKSCCSISIECNVKGT